MLVNVYQASLMVVAAVLIILFVGIELYANPGIIEANEDAARLLNPLGTFSPLGMLVFSGTYIVHGFLFATCNPNVLARITKGNVDEIPKIRWVYMGFMQSLWWLMTCVGVALALLNVEATDPDSVGAAFALTHMAPVLLGLFVAGVAAASLSTGESQLLVTANALVKDLFPGTFRALSERGRRIALIIGRVVIAAGLLAVLMNVNSQQIGNLVIQAATLVVAGFAVPALLFVFNLAIGGRMMALTIVAGAAASVWVRANLAPPPGQEIYAGLAAAILVAGLGYLMSRNKV